MTDAYSYMADKNTEAHLKLPQGYDNKTRKKTKESDTKDSYSVVEGSNAVNSMDTGLMW